MSALRFLRSPEGAPIVVRSTRQCSLIGSDRITPLWYVRLGYTDGIVTRFGVLRGPVFRRCVIVGQLRGLDYHKLYLALCCVFFSKHQHLHQTTNTLSLGFLSHSSLRASPLPPPRGGFTAALHTTAVLPYSMISCLRLTDPPSNSALHSWWKMKKNNIPDRTRRDGTNLLARFSILPAFIVVTMPSEIFMHAA